jgi:hypothetical protein
VKYSNRVLTAVQVPLADLRHFVAEPTARLMVPPWPLADPSRHFVRAVGHVRRRRRGGSRDWIGESIYCDAKHALILTQDRAGVSHGGSQHVYIKPTYRRLFAAGHTLWPGTVARFDLGFEVLCRRPNGRLTKSELPTAREAATAVSTVNLRMWPKGQSRALVDSADLMAARLELATTSLRASSLGTQPWWVQAGQPLLIVETIEDEHLETSLNTVPKRADIDIESDSSLANVTFTRIDHRGKVTPVWILAYDATIDLHALRQLRMHLWRLHNEREVLKIVLSECLQRRLDPAHPALRDYLARQSRGLRKKNREGIKTSSILRYAYSLDSLINVDDIAELDHILRDVSPGVSASVLPLASQPVNVTIQSMQVAVYGEVKVDKSHHSENDYSQYVHNTGSAGAIIGGAASVSGGNFLGSGKQDIQILDTVQMEQLVRELSLLSTRLTEMASTPDEHAAAAAIQAAAESATKNDKQALWDSLKKSGKWVLNIALELGTGVAAAVIAAALP